MAGRHTRRFKAEINVVPYIDVMLVLLIIFMVTAPMVQPVEITLPSVGKGSQASTRPIEVQIAADGSLSWRDLQAGGVRSRGNEAELLAAIKAKQAANPEQPVVIAGDRAARYDAVLRVMDLLQREQVTRVGLLAQPLPGR